MERLARLAKRDDVVAVRRWLTTNPLPRVAGERRHSAVHVAVRRRCVPVLTALLDAGLDANVRIGPASRSPLDDAAIGGDARIVQALLQGGADADARNSDGWTALHFCVATDNTQGARALLDHGCDTRICAKWPRECAAGLARRRGSDAVADAIDVAHAARCRWAATPRSRCSR